MIKLSAFVAAALLALTNSTYSQAWPQHPVNIVVPTAAGGAIDTTARVIANFLQEKWGQSVVIENRPGAAMRIGADYVARSPADGYTLLVGHDGTMAMNAVVYKKLTYDPQRDFTPLALIASIPEVLAVNSAVPASTVRDLIDLAKKRPGALNHGSGGTATLLALELFKSMAGVDIASVPFPGGVPAVNAVLSGSVETLFADVATASAALHSPNARLLAVTTLNKQKFLPTLPTIDESGVPGYDVRTWMGAFAPANTPPDVARKIENDISEAMRSPSVRGRLEAIGMEMGKGGAAEMRDTLAADIAKWGKLIRERNIAIDQN